MRMIGIGLMGFLLAGIALLLSNLNLWEKGQRYVQEFTSGPELVFEHRIAAGAQGPNRANILRANSDHPVILSGLPAYQSVAFIMPVDARPTSGYLQIDATSQVLDGVEGVLRISIHNTRRAEMLLRPGEAGRSLQIPLSPTDLAGAQLVVSFSLQGVGPSQHCGPQDGVAAIVEIETTSSVSLTLDRPLLSVRDQVHAWGDVVRIAWPSWLKRDEQLRRLVLATEFKRRGLATTFEAGQASTGLSSDALRSALPNFPAPVVAAGAPPAAGRAGVRRFYRQTVWRERYDLGAGHAAIMPTAFDLHLLLGRRFDQDDLTLSVTLNNSLVLHDIIPAAQRDYHAVIDLPHKMQAPENTIEITLNSAAVTNGACDQGPEIVAELLPETRLVPGAAVFDDPLAEVHTALENIGPVNVAMPTSLTSLDASRVSHLLDQVIPKQVNFKPAGAKTHMTVLRPGDTAPDVPGEGPRWLVMQDIDGGLLIQRLEPGAMMPVRLPALVVTPGGAKLQAAKG